MSELDIRPQAPGEQDAVLDVVRRAFGAEDVGEGKTVAGLVAAMQDEAETLGTVSLVAVADGAVVGHVGLTRGWVDALERLVAVPVLSPLSVLPEHQGRGVGSALLAAAASYADETGAPLIVLEGAPGTAGASTRSVCGARRWRWWRQRWPIGRPARDESSEGGAA